MRKCLELVSLIFIFKRACCHTTHLPDTTIPTVYSIQTSGGELALPPETEVIVAADAWTPRILWMAGIWAPIYPMVSQSLTSQFILPWIEQCHLHTAKLLSIILLIK